MNRRAVLAACAALGAAALAAALLLRWATTSDPGQHDPLGGTP